MNIFVSAKFNDKERVKEAYDVLKQSGHAITHEWIHNRSSLPYAENKVFAARCAAEDFEGVLRADVFILLSHPEPSLGASGELGAAIASFSMTGAPRIYVVGPHFGVNFCFWHPAVQQVNSIEDILAEIRE